jgi:hypothetical protein
LGPFGAPDNTRALEGSELDQLLERVLLEARCGPFVRSFLACSLEQWEDLHLAQLLPLLSPRADSPTVLVLPLHLSDGEVQHWVTLFIDVRAKEIVLVDPLPQPEDSDERAAFGPLHSWLMPIHATLRQHAHCFPFGDYHWRSSCLGVQLDDHNCGVWVAAIVKQWLAMPPSPPSLQSLRPPLCKHVRIEEMRAASSTALYPCS